MVGVYKKFRSSASYLTHFHLFSLCFISILDFILYFYFHRSLPVYYITIPALLFFSSVNFKLVFATFLGLMVWSFTTTGLQSIDVLLFFIAIPWTFFATSMIHNAAHGNFKPSWLGRLIGEVFGVIQLAGFPEWVITHIIHHSHPDDPERDPHPPMTKGYWDFMLSMRNSVVNALLKDYFSQFGNGTGPKNQIKALIVLSRLEQIAKIVFWWLLLSQNAFIFFFCASIVFKMLHYAWFNWATHKYVDGKYKIINLDNWLYRMINSVSFGLYYHENHHLNPRLFNPKNYKPITKEAAKVG